MTLSPAPIAERVHADFAKANIGWERKNVNVFVAGVDHQRQYAVAHRVASNGLVVVWHHFYGFNEIAAIVVMDGAEPFHLAHKVIDVLFNHAHVGSILVHTHDGGRDRLIGGGLVHSGGFHPARALRRLGWFAGRGSAVTVAPLFNSTAKRCSDSSDSVTESCRATLDFTRSSARSSTRFSIRASIHSKNHSRIRIRVSPIRKAANNQWPASGIPIFECIEPLTGGKHQGGGKLLHGEFLQVSGGRPRSHLTMAWQSLSETLLNFLPFCVISGVGAQNIYRATATINSRKSGIFYARLLAGVTEYKTRKRNKVAASRYCFELPPPRAFLVASQKGIEI